jgi:hypothetical protein
MRPPKKHKIYVSLHLGKDMKLAMATVIVTREIVTEFTSRIENVVHNLFTDNFSSPELYDDLLTKTRNCCVTARSN